MKWVYRILFKFIHTQKRLWVTFDTQLMTSKVNECIQNGLVRFPVPSSFPLNSHNIFPDAQHYRVLVNLRSFPNSDLHQLLQASCKFCTFVFPRGPLASTPLALEFGHYSNAYFDEYVIPVLEYKSYIDTFDYMIFLYEPSIDASGRILDSITRRVPVCVPRQASEWAFIAKTWGRSALFDWGSVVDISRMFDHPEFSEPTTDSNPPFTPDGSLNEIANIGLGMNSRKSASLRILMPVVYLAVLLHSLSASVLSVGYQLMIYARVHVPIRRSQAR
jgi:hypothetical protein